MNNTGRITAIERLQAISNEARLDLYELLLGDSPATVSALATRAGLKTGSVSYHLAALERFGYVESVERSGDNRERWWRAVPGGVRWSPADFLGSSAGLAAAAQAQRVLIERQMRRVATWLANFPTWDADWLDAATFSDAVLCLTAAELRDLATDLQALKAKYRRRTEIRAGAAGARDVEVLIYAFPREHDDQRTESRRDA